ncbi:MAG: hypothetical protein GY943_33325 [Chloroflexi bacterium]|nr:hypothetical protein [Chloroflexota bacterium]
MKNGDSFTIFVQETQQYLAELVVVTYYQEPLPSETDDRFTAIISRFISSDKAQQTRLLDALSAKERSLFGIYGHRSATVAARTAVRERLLSGLVGMAIANYTIPEKRRVEVSLAVFHHVARKLDLNVIELFEDTAVYASTEFAPILLAFGRKGDVTLKKYGWQELKTDDGVKYKIQWG